MINLPLVIITTISKDSGGGLDLFNHETVVKANNEAFHEEGTMDKKSPS